MADKKPKTVEQHLDVLRRLAPKVRVDHAIKVRKDGLLLSLDGLDLDDPQAIGERIARATEDARAMNEHKKEAAEALGEVCKHFGIDRNDIPSATKCRDPKCDGKSKGPRYLYRCEEHARQLFYPLRKFRGEEYVEKRRKAMEALRVAEEPKTE